MVQERTNHTSSTVSDRPGPGLPDLSGARIRKRDGREVPFDRSRIDHAVEMAFRAEVGTPFPDPLPAVVADRITDVTDAVLAALSFSRPGGMIATVEEVQDEVERQLMATGAYSVARRYILYREARARRRDEHALRVVDASGQELLVDRALLRSWIAQSVQGQEAGRIEIKALEEDVLATVHPGMTLGDLDQSIVLAARARIEVDPGYSSVAARALLRGIYGEVLGRRVAVEDAREFYPFAIATYVEQAAERGWFTLTC